MSYGQYYISRLSGLCKEQSVLCWHAPGMHVDLRAFHIHASCLCRLAELGREKAAAEARAVLAVTQKAESQRAAAEQLQEALQQNENLAEVSTQIWAAAAPLSAMRPCLVM